MADSDSRSSNGEIYEVDGLYCTNCSHDLNHYLYDIRVHPVLSVPLCIVCDENVSKDIESGNDYELEEKCFWCFDYPQKDLFVCANSENGCIHQFCDTCINEHLGDKYLSTVRNDEDWKCFSCDPTPLKRFSEAIKAGKAQSVINQMNAIMFETEDAKIEFAVEIFRNLVKESDESTSLLEQDALDEKEREIRKELQSLDEFEGSVSKRSKEELQKYIDFWQHHMDIIQREECIIADFLEYYGYDIRNPFIYDLRGEKLLGDGAFADQQFVQAAEKEMQERDERERRARYDNNENISFLNEGEAVEASAFANVALRRASTTTTTRKPWKYTEYVVETPVENMVQLQEQADKDDLVMKYHTTSDLPVNTYPPSFEFVVPKTVLKALYYCNEEELSTLAKNYNIPVHIAIVMSNADEEIPPFCKEWSFARLAHPAVLKALFHANSPIDQAILCEHYQLDSDYCTIADFGDTKEIFDHFDESVKQRNGIQKKYTYRTFQNAWESERNNAQAMREKAIVSVYKNATSSSSSVAQDGNNTNIHSKIESMVEATKSHNYSDDEYELLKERHSTILSMNKSLKRSEEHQAAAIGGSGVEGKDVVPEKKFKNKLAAWIDEHQYKGNSSPTTPATKKRDTPSKEDNKSNDANSNNNSAELDNLEQHDSSAMIDYDASEENNFVDNHDDVSDIDDEEDEDGTSRRHKKKTQQSLSASLSAEHDSKSNNNNDNHHETIESHSKGGKETTKNESDDHTVESKGLESLDDSRVQDTNMEVDNEDDDEEADEPVNYSRDDEEDAGKNDETKATEHDSTNNSTATKKENTSHTASTTNTATTTTTASVPAPSHNHSSNISASMVIDLVTSSDDDDDDDDDDDKDSSDKDSNDSNDEIKKKTNSNNKSDKSKVKKESDGSSSSEQEDDESSKGKNEKEKVKSNTASNAATTITTSQVNATGKKVLLSQSGGSGQRRLTDFMPSTPKPRPSNFCSLLTDDEEDAGLNESTKDGNPKSAKKIVPQLSETTKQALESEKKRKRELYSTMKHFEDDTNEGMAMNSERPEGEPAVYVVKSMVQSLKVHQVEGVRFIWNNVAESIASLGKVSVATNGCLLAHCMGLGKTLTIIAFVATILTNPIISEIKDPIALKEFQAKNKPPEPAATTANNNNKSNEEFNISQSSQITLMNVKRLFHRILIVAPKNTLQNWELEFKRWTPRDLLEHIPIYLLMSSTSNQKGSAVKNTRLRMTKQWYEDGGVLIISYEMFRLSVGDDETDKNNGKGAGKGKNAKKDVGSTKTTNEGGNVEEEIKPTKAEANLYKTYFLNPGPDLVIADEAHIIKNRKSKISINLNAMRTKRRIALTGSPLQNNLEEYWCMVNWVKHRYLYSLEEFRKRFMLPIQIGNSRSATQSEMLTMKKRTHVLHKKLEPVVHRRDLTILQDILLPKREFILSIKMTSFQKFLYKYYLSRLGTLKGVIFRAYQSLMRVWNHPSCAVIHYKETLSTTKSTSNSKKGSEKYRTTKGLRLDTLKEELSLPLYYFAQCNPSKMKEIENRAIQLEERLRIASNPKPATTTTTSSSEELYFDEKELNTLTGKGKDNNIAMKQKEKEKVKENEKKDKWNMDESSEDESNNSDSNNGYDSEDEDDLDGFVVDDDEEISSDNDSDDDDDSEDAVDSDDEDDDSSDKDSREDDSDYEHQGKVDEDVLIDSDNDNQQQGNKRRKRLRTAAVVSRKKLKKAASSSSSKKNSSKTSKKLFKPKGKVLVSDDDDDEMSVDDDEDDGDEDDDDSERKQKKKKRKKDTNTATVANNDEVLPSVTGTVIEDTTIRITPQTSGLSIKIADRKAAKPGAATAGTTTNTTAGEGGDLSTDKIEEIFENEEELSDELGNDWWKFSKELNYLYQERNIKPLHMKQCPQLNHFQLLELSNKMVTLFGLLAMSVKHGDKMLVFSQSLYTLDSIQMFLHMSNWGEKVGCYDRSLGLSSWTLGHNYLRIDGSISNRQQIIDNFNKQSRIKLLLISTKAGNMGINLQGANRIVIFDSSWNPVHDLQAIFRAYRFGQTKNVFVYRFLASGTMEEKIYRSQVMKQTLSARVVDAQMPDSHFNETNEYLALSDDEFDDDGDKEDEEEDEDNEEVEGDDGTTKEKKQKEKKKHYRQEELKRRVMDTVKSGTQDRVFLDFVETFGTSLFSSFEDHDSLLMDRVESHLNEEERRAAEEEFELEVLASVRQQMQVPVPANNAAATLSRQAAPWQPTEDNLLVAIRQVYRNDATFQFTTSVMNQPQVLQSHGGAPRTPNEIEDRYHYLLLTNGAQELLRTETVRNLVSRLQGLQNASLVNNTRKK